MSAYTVLLICEPLSGQTVALAKDMHKHLNGIHLEDQSTGGDLTPGAFLRSCRGFTARRGLPPKIVSDNGTTFKAACKKITEWMENPVVKHYLTEKSDK